MLRHIPPGINGQRINLRSYSGEDGVALWQAIEESRGHLAAWQDWVNRINSWQDAELTVRKVQSDWILRTRLAWIIRLQDQFLGHIQLEHIVWETPSFGIGYWLCRSAEGRGYVTEAAKLLCQLAFETLGAQRLHIECDARNQRSASVARRLGFKQEAVLRNERRDSSGKLQNTLQFAMVPEDYQFARAKW